jgi:gluconolactonase
VQPDGSLSNKRLYVSAQGPGAYDGIAVDALGNVWCALGSDGSLGTDPAGLDGVRVYDPTGRALAHIHLPERCANLCFGGPKRNRLFMAASHSLYALHLNVRGAVA